MRFFILAALCQFAGFTWGESGLPVAESILVDKSERKMWLINEGRKYREYDISLGDEPVGHKEREGDERTPARKYVIDYRNPQSRYHLSLHINYPRKQDEENARKKGFSPGGNIFIHGLPNGAEFMARKYRGRDWTDGCIAVNNREIEEIWQLVKDGTTIEIMY